MTPGTTSLQQTQPYFLYHLLLGQNGVVAQSTGSPVTQPPDFLSNIHRSSCRFAVHCTLPYCYGSDIGKEVGCDVGCDVGSDVERDVESDVS